MKTIEWSGPARSDLKKLARSTLQRVFRAVEELAASQLGDVKKLKGTNPPEWRLRVGDYRVLFTLEADVLIVLRIRHRREAYR